MKKILIVFIFFVFYQIFVNSSKPESKVEAQKWGAFSSTGKPLTWVFTANGCTTPCLETRRLLRARDVVFEQINVSEGVDQLEVYKKYSNGNRFPTIISGSRRLVGFNREQLLSVLAETYGSLVLTVEENVAMAEHFDVSGDPIVVMYGTQSCGYCKKAARYFDSKGIQYTNLDIEYNSAAKRSYETLRGVGTPLIYVGYRRVDGFNQSEIDQALKLLPG